MGVNRVAMPRIATDVVGYVFTNRLHVFLIPIIVTVFWNTVFKLPLPLEYYVMILCTTAGGYIYNMYTDGPEDAINYQAQYRLFRPDTRYTKPVIMLCFLVGLLLSLRAGWFFVLYGGLIHLLAACYSAPLPVRVAGGQRLRIKEIPVIKNVYVALHWSAVLVVTPFLYVRTPPTSLSLVAIAVSFGLAYFIELLWDWRDIRGDALAGVRTVPVLLGESATIWILRGVHAVTCLVALVAALANDLSPGFLLAVALHLPLGLLFLEWYRRFDDKEAASHLYVVYAGLVLSVGMAWDRAVAVFS